MPPIAQARAAAHAAIDSIARIDCPRDRLAWIDLIRAKVDAAERAHYIGDHESVITATMQIQLMTDLVALCQPVAGVR
jgi:hypothetical protein